MNKTPISTLQELMMQRKQSLPDYYTENCENIPGASFKCTVKAGKIVACGYDTTKQGAKQNSAQKALEAFGFCQPAQRENSSSVITRLANVPKSPPSFNYVGILNEYASAHVKPYPNYSDGVTINGKFITQCVFLNWTTEGYGFKKKDSKQDSARRMLEKVKTEDISALATTTKSLEKEKLEKIDKLTEEILKTYEKLSISNHSVVSDKTEFLPIPNLKKNVTSLEELKRELDNYSYKYTIEPFQQHPYIMMMKVNDTSAVLMGQGQTKKEALRDLLETAVHMFSYGFSLTSQF